MKKWLGEGAGWQTARKSFETDRGISSRAEGGLNMMVHEDGGDGKKSRERGGKLFFGRRGRRENMGKLGGRKVF